MLRALAEAGIRPDLVLGTSVGAINRALVAADPVAGAARLTRMWQGEELRLAFSERLWGRAVRLVRSGTHLHSLEPLRRMLASLLPGPGFSDLSLPFHCVAASSSRPPRAGSRPDRWCPRSWPRARAGAAAAGRDRRRRTTSTAAWSTRSRSGRAVALGATTVYVLQVGRIESPLAVPRRPWEVGLVAFEIARRHRFHEEMSALPRLGPRARPAHRGRSGHARPGPVPLRWTVAWVHPVTARRRARPSPGPPRSRSPASRPW